MELNQLAFVAIPCIKTIETANGPLQSSGYIDCGRVVAFNEDYAKVDCRGTHHTIPRAHTFDNNFNPIQ